MPDKEKKAKLSRRPYGGRPVLTYGSLVLAVVVGIVVVELWPANEAVERYGPNIVAELFGILVTLAVVERLLTWQRERAATPVRTVALRRVWYQLNGLTHMLLFAYKAAAPPGSPEPTSLEALLENWQREARFLDFRRPYGPDGPPRSWHQYAAEVLTRFEDGIRDVIDRYLPVLGPELPAAAEDVIDHPVFQIVKNGPALERLDASHGWHLPRPSFLVESVEDPALDSLQDFSRLLARLYEAYDRLGGPAVTLDARLYEDHLSPAWASGRAQRADVVNR
jgi:hypothetical protein